MKNFNRLLPRYARFAPPLFLSSQDLYASDTVKNFPLGTMAFGSHGRIFRYALAGASNLVLGNVLQAAAQDTQFENMAVLASPIVLVQNGQQTVNITNGTTTVVPNQYINGQVTVYTTPDLGSEYDITSVSGTLTSGGALVVGLDHPLNTAWTTSTKVTMKPSPWAGVLQFPATTQTGIPVGVVINAIPATQYGWVQTHGLASVLSDGSTFAVGSEVGTPSGTAGAATVFAAGTTHARIGTTQMAAASGHNISVNLLID